MSLSLPKPLVFRYLLDWILIIVTVVVAGNLSRFSPNHRPFDPKDPTLSFPHVHHEKIPTVALVCLAVVLPAVSILCFCLLAPASSAAFSRETKETIWKRKAVNLNRAWMGLGMSIAMAMFVTDGLKNIIGKPRPDLISRCQPDLKGVTSVLVDSSVCTSTNSKVLNDGFRSFPSGHSSMSFAGLAYLAIFMYTSFVLTTSQSSPLLPTAEEGDNNKKKKVKSLYPPNSLPIPFFIVLITPFFLAAYIASTRFSDYRHHGFDILSGSTLGIAVALISSWWYAHPSSGGVGRGRTRAGYGHFGPFVDGLATKESRPLVNNNSTEYSRETV